MKKQTYIEQTKRLTALLREMRVKAGLTQTQLAARMGKEQPFISKYESGVRRLDVLEMREVCQALGVSLEEFVKRLEKAL